LIQPRQQLRAQGLQARVREQGEPAQVIVDTRDAGPAPVEAKVTNPAGERCSIELTPTEEEGVFAGEYGSNRTGILLPGK